MQSGRNVYSIGTQQIDVVFLCQHGCGKCSLPCQATGESQSPVTKMAGHGGLPPLTWATQAACTLLFTFQIHHLAKVFRTGELHPSPKKREQISAEREAGISKSENCNGFLLSFHVAFYKVQDLPWILHYLKQCFASMLSTKNTLYLLSQS